MNIYTVKSTDIVHNTSVDLATRWCTREVNIVQYDNSQPIVAVELFKNSERFVLPDGYEANLRFSKKDRTFIYKPVLGCNQGRDTVYFAVDEQMSMFYGKVNPIIELTYNGAVVGSSSIPFVIDRNPIQIGDVESKSDYPAIVERISASEAAVADAKKAVDAEAAERAAGDAKTLSDARAYTDSRTSGLINDSTIIKSNITTLQSDVASLKTDNIQNKTNISNKQDILVSGTNIKSINGQSLLGSGDMTVGLPSPWVVDETVLGIKSGQGNEDHTGLINMSGFLTGYGAMRYNGEDPSKIFLFLPTFSSEDTAIVNYSSFDDGIESYVKLPTDFITKSQEINLGDINTNKAEIANKQDKLVSGTNIKTINGESILGSGNITINGGSGLAAPWSIDENYLGVWSKSSPGISENDFFAGLHTNRDLVGFEATNFVSGNMAVIIPTLTSDIPLFQFCKADGSVTSMVKLPNDFFTRSQTINLGGIANSGGSGSGSGRPPLYSHTITLKASGNSAYFIFTIYLRTDYGERITKNNLFDYLDLAVCSGIGVVSNALIDKITFSTRADNTRIHKFLELSGQHIDEELTFDSVFGTDFTVKDVDRGPDWTAPR